MDWTEKNADFVTFAQRTLKARGFYAGAIDGKAGRLTRRALAQAVDADDVATLLPGFTGDLEWVHQQEGHAGHPYWPGGGSGVTIDPGLDLGHAGKATIDAALPLYGFTDDQERDLRAVVGIKGRRAKALAKALEWIKISRDDASRILPHIAAKYWREIVGRFPPLATAPGPVQTALLSLGFNRGEWNAGLAPLAEPLRAGDWKTVARIIGSMQQNHRLAGIRSRRRLEAALVDTALA